MQNRMKYSYLVQYTGCVCAEAESGDRCTGVLLLSLLSQRTIWPEYVPPIIRLGWNRAKVADMTALYNKKLS